MSEIKGQILGVILVLAVFGVVGTTLYTAFKTASNDVANKITGSVNEDNIKNNTNSLNIIDNSNIDLERLLTY